MTTTSERQQGLALLDRIQPLLLLSAIAIGLVLASVSPTFAAGLTPLVTIGVFLVIYFIMLGVNTGGIMHAFTRWKPTGLAIGINFLVTPFIAWMLGFLFLQNDPDIWVGLILYLVTPCIGWYLVFTELAKGDVELGISLLFWNVVLQIVLLPVYMALLAGTVVQIEITEMVRSVIVFLVLPLALAAATRWVLGRYAISVDDAAKKIRLPYLKAITLMVVIAAMFASQGAVLFENPAVVLKMMLPGVAFFVIALVMAIAAARLFRLSYREFALLVFTTTARNSEVSLAIAVSAFASPLVALTVVIGPSIELPVLILFLRIVLLIQQKGWFSPAAPAVSPFAESKR
ncbi:bile acid:sodium symporter [uncultured Chloroflexus sp.]|uniref:arsenic resistance protein n=1 Tax=uncultured Chloroflexus sp. TaxID=214040 RepID=UPI0026229095|nr:bile acid:sodium symporter [uncultured Chloroflexus sp.]